MEAGEQVITISTKLLAAVSKWAYSSDDRPHLSVVLFRDDEMVATDGHRLVRVPVASNGLTLAVDREHISAAVAAQACSKRDAAQDPKYGGSAVEITKPDKRIVIKLGRIAIAGPAGDPLMYPPFNQVMPKGQNGSPDGRVFNPAYLAAIDEVRQASGGGSHGVRIVAWGGEIDAALFESYGGIRYVIMPMRDTVGGGGR
jgi:hypothetical protein